MRAVIYARYSSSSQREASIEQQIEKCTDYAERNGLVIVKTYADKAMTGRNDDRPNLQRLLSDCSKNVFDVVLIYAMDRFGRNVLQSLENAYIIETENHKKIISVTENFDDSSMGRFFRTLQMATAQMRSDDMSERIRLGMKYNSDRCLYNGGGVPLGYKIENQRFVINPDTAPIVKMIFELYAEGITVTEISNRLNAQ